MLEKLQKVVTEAIRRRRTCRPAVRTVGQRRATVAGATEQARRRKKLFVNGGNGVQREAERRQRQPDREDRASVVARRRASGAAWRAPQAMETIAEKITIVQEIARQTDLLALNAAVEAARPANTAALRGRRFGGSQARERSQAAAQEIGRCRSRR